LPENKTTNRSDLQKKALRVNWGTIFAQIFSEFVKVARDFRRILWNFPGFSPNQNFWGAVACPHPSPVFKTETW